MDDRSQLQVMSLTKADLVTIRHSRPLRPFAKEVVAFLGDLSEALVSDSRVRIMPDVYSFGFWCRRAALSAMQRDYCDLDRRLGRGVVFHIAPGNIPVNFAYSLATGLLAGNSNIVRLPSKDFEQVRIITESINAVMSLLVHQGLRDHIRLVRYDRDDHEISSELSAICDVRVIWGGDTTINNIRRHQISSRSFDVTFADRYSACVIDAYEYLNAPDRSEIARGFYNDTYLFDQNACTAPHLVLWLGSKEVVDHARDGFWSELHAYTKERYRLEPKSAVDKWANALRYAALNAESQIIKGEDNLISRLLISRLEPGIEDSRGNCGFFFESQIDKLDQLLPIVSRRFQTLSYLGLDKAVLQDLVIKGRALGIDRIVPIGRTLDFSLKWDGYDLINTLSRLLTVA